MDEGAGNANLTFRVVVYFVRAFACSNFPILSLQGNADRARIVMVGDVLKKVSAVSGDALVAVQDVRHTV